MKKKWSFLILFTIMVMLLAVPSQAAKVKLNKGKATVVVGKTVKLKATGTTSKVKWSSSNKKVATVSASGKVKGIKAGKATITAKANGKKAKCTVTVIKDYDLGVYYGKNISKLKKAFPKTKPFRAYTSGIIRYQVDTGIEVYALHDKITAIYFYGSAPKKYKLFGCSLGMSYLKAGYDISKKGFKNYSYDSTGESVFKKNNSMYLKMTFGGDMIIKTLALSDSKY